VHVAVSDEGPGIALVDHERVFERGVRACGTANLGLGLGLFVARTR
jgi:signal transduction histidine kinase